MRRRTACVDNSNRTQIVTIPQEFRFPKDVKEVFICKVGEDVILSPRPTAWKACLDSEFRASDDFMKGVKDLPIRKRRAS